MNKIKKINGKYVELFDERTFDRLFQMKYGIKRDAFCKRVKEDKIVLRLGMSRKVKYPTEKAYTEILLKILFTSCRSELEVNLTSEIFDNWIT